MVEETAVVDVEIEMDGSSVTSILAFCWRALSVSSIQEKRTKSEVDDICKAVKSRSRVEHVRTEFKNNMRGNSILLWSSVQEVIYTRCGQRT